MTDIDASDPLFDLSKKKKKKKVNRDDPEKEVDENTTTPSETMTLKEKKGKSVAFAADSSENKENPVEQQPTSEATAAPGEDDEADEVNLLALKKKKKKKPKDTIAGAAGESDVKKETAGGIGGDEATSDTTPLQGEYTYDDLLTRVFNIIREKNPGVMDGGEKIKLTLKPPQVARIGTKRTSFSNFGEICRSLKRQEKHLHQYLLAELGTNGSIDANNALTIKGRFQQKQIESVLRSYIKEYVICKTCRSPDTLLQKEERLSVLLCNNCRSRYFVTNIKTGFQAQVGKRAATRAKAT